jgi:hypothetical protein
MMPLALAVILSVSAVAPCDESDVVCLRAQLLQKATECEMLSRELDATKRLNDVLTQRDAIHAASLEAAQKTLREAASAHPSTQSLAREPALWIGIGLFAGIGLTLLTVFAVGQTLRPVASGQ